MTHVLVVDDEVIFHGMVARALEGLNFTISTAIDGKAGLAMARSLKPDLIITDVMMPDVTGYELTQTLRREPDFAHTPILVLTAQSGLQDKLKSFEAGADDHLTKPFEPAELAARVLVLLRRAETARALAPATSHLEARMIAVHSLRGGIGTSSIAVNLAIGLNALWNLPTVLVDLCMMAGQVALMLDAPLKRTWADLARFDAAGLDAETLNSVLSQHESGLSFIAAPTLPAEAETIKADALGAALHLLKQRFGYIVADLPHDFQASSLQALDAADMIVLVVAPDMASIRAAAAALDTYKKLGYPPEKIKLALNATFPKLGLPREKIEAALGLPASIVIPYTQDLFVESINFGQPLLYYKPKEAVSQLLEDFAFYISKTEHKKTRPTEPSEAWGRVYKRYNERHKA
jgi:pilus assembly protein CpaE